MVFDFKQLSLQPQIRRDPSNQIWRTNSLGLVLQPSACGSVSGISVTTVGQMELQLGQRSDNNKSRKTSGERAR